MNPKAALCAALLDGKIVNSRNIHYLTSYTNASREICRSIEEFFGVRCNRTNREGRSRYGTRCSWTDYYLPRTPENEDGIVKMREYINNQKNIKHELAIDTEFYQG